MAGRYFQANNLQNILLVEMPRVIGAFVRAGFQDASASGVRPGFCGIVENFIFSLFKLFFVYWREPSSAASPHSSSREKTPPPPC